LTYEICHQKQQQQQQKQQNLFKNERLKREVNINALQVFNENKMLRDDIEKQNALKKRSYSPLSLKTELRAESKANAANELERLTNENKRLKE
jgi:hypothetical protein